MQRPSLTDFERRIAPGQLRHSGGILSSIEGFLPEKQGALEVLDFGCGSGAMLECLRDRRGARVVGVDVADNHLFDVPFVPFDGRRLPFADGTFDVAMEVFALHHSPTLEANLAEMARVSRDRIVLVEDVWDGWGSLARLYAAHVAFDAFMLGLAALGRARWCTPFRYDFRDRAGWLEIFERLGLPLIAEAPLSLGPDDRVLHHVFVLGCGRGQPAAERPGSTSELEPALAA